MSYLSASDGVEDTNEIGENLSSTGRLRGDVCAGWSWLADGHRVGVVQQTVVAQSGQALQHTDHVVWGNLLHAGPVC